MLRSFYEKLISVRSLVQEGIGVIGTAALLAAVFIPGTSEKVIKVTAVGAFLVAVVLYVLIRRAAHMATPDDKSVYFISCPCTPADLDDAIEIAQYYFGSDSMRPDIVRAAYRVNPFSFLVIKDAAGKVLGYFDPLRA